MALIVRNNTKIKFNRIIAYGCSFTSGFELADDQLLKDIDVDKFKKKHGAEHYFDHIRTIPNSQFLETQLAWPKWLSDKFKVDYVNRAVEGAGNDASIYHLEQDIESGFITDSDLIIIGLTESRRWFWIDHNNTPQYPCIGGTNRRWPSEKFHKDFVAFVANQNFLNYTWWKSIRYIDMLSERYNNRILQQFCYKSHNSDFKSFIDSSFSFDNLVDWNDRKQVHYYMHPHVDFHKKFADHLYEKLT
jgi:hypothetical protein